MYIVLLVVAADLHDQPTERIESGIWTQSSLTEYEKLL
jgi:hypothetical protein